MKQPTSKKPSKPSSTGMKYCLREKKPLMLTPPPMVYNGKKIAVKTSYVT
jgi:hypothetical protein